jgi:hypothetical protein
MTLRVAYIADDAIERDAEALRARGELAVRRQ